MFSASDTFKFSNNYKQNLSPNVFLFLITVQKLKLFSTEIYKERAIHNALPFTNIDAGINRRRKAFDKAWFKGMSAWKVISIHYIAKKWFVRDHKGQGGGPGLQFSHRWQQNFRTGGFCTMATGLGINPKLGS